MEAPENNQEEPQRNKQITFIIAIYLLLTMSSHFTLDQSPFNRNVMQIIKNAEGGDPPVKTMFSIFSVESYEGIWTPLGARLPNILTRESGKLSMNIFKYSSSEKIDFELEMQLNNGEYIDEGSVTLRAIISSEKWQSSRNGTRVTLTPKLRFLNLTENSENNEKMRVLYREDRVLRTLTEKILAVQDMSLVLQYNNEQNKVDVWFQIESQQISAKLRIARQESKMFSTIIFAAMLFFISYMQFSAVMEILRALFEGRESSANYSMTTMMAATMWDAVLCILSFVQAFTNEQNLILFIMPAFILCLLFTNLELRMMLMIFQSRAENNNLRDIICKFNLITYGGLVLMYPILVYTNLSLFFFIGISLIFVPQIYANGIQGHRPDISSPYYSKFLTYRFLLIIYLKCFPWNIFELAPDYFLGVACLLCLAFQIFLLWIQKQYGPKKVLPQFLLPPVFNYRFDVEEEGAKIANDQNVCPICLVPLFLESEEELGYNIPHKVMKAPCSHCFHGICLVKWMELKMSCPQCRATLPPFE